MSKLAFGCSHTFGTGVEKHEAWPFHLNAINFGKEGCSTDYIARTINSLLSAHNPHTVYILWPNWTRFEYVVNGEYKQSLPSDKNRIQFMETATDEWLHSNFNKQQLVVKNLCNQYNARLVALTLDDLVPFIDHADKWPLSKLGHHYAPTWHTWVADIFRQKENDKT